MPKVSKIVRVRIVGAYEDAVNKALSELDFCADILSLVPYHDRGAQVLIVYAESCDMP